VENEGSQRRFESVYSTKVRAGKRRTYFFDVRQTKGEDYYVTLTESTKKFNNDGYERHKIFLYKEDFNRFIASLEDVINHVKTELMPDYDYDEYTKRQAEWEAKKAAEMEAEANGETIEASANETAVETNTESTGSTEEPASDSAEKGSEDIEEDISW